MVAPPFTKEDAEKEILAYLRRLASQIVNFDLDYAKVYKKIKASIEKITVSPS